MSDSVDNAFDDNLHHGSTGIDRRGLIKKGAIVAGAAWTAPIVLGSFASPAAAATGFLDFVSAAPSAGQPGARYSVSVPSNKTIYYELIGGGGGGGNVNTFQGGSGTKIMGAIPPQAAPYTLYLYVAGGGAAGATTTADTVAGGSGFCAGGAGNAIANTISGYTGMHGIPGGGGGGASAIVSSDGSAVKIVAAGGGGASGGTDNEAGAPGITTTGATRFTNISVANTVLTGSTGNNGGGSYKGSGGKGGASLDGGAGGAGSSWSPAGSAGTSTAGGQGGTGSNAYCGAGGGGGGGLFGGGGGGGASYSGTNNEHGGGAGGCGSSVANGPAGITGTAYVQDQTNPSDASASDPTGTGPGHCGLGGHSKIGPRSFGKAGGNGAVKLSATPFSANWPTENATP